ncbi:MAG: hypothetical protein FWG87_12580 [Defluviitaleaceae bacterium]|nr:hypothetical protein [Defluviitaleaceae bacterium]
MMEYPRDKNINIYLDSLSNEYKNLLFNNFLTHSPSLDDLSISELIRIDAEIKKPLVNSTYSKTQRLRKMFFTSGLLYIFIGFVTLLINSVLLAPNVFNTNLIALGSTIIGFIGICMLSFSFYRPRNLNRLISTKKAQETLLRYEALEKCKELHEAIKRHGETTKSLSIIDYLSETLDIKDTDFKNIKGLLRLRNCIVHNIDNDVTTPKELLLMLKATDKTIKELKRQTAETQSEKTDNFAGRVPATKMLQDVIN